MSYGPGYGASNTACFLYSILYDILCHIIYVVYVIWSICRLNSEDFLNFLWCLDIIFLTYSYERNDCEVQKNDEFFRIYSNFREFSPFFEVFYRKTFLRSKVQSRGTHQTIPCEISRRMDSVRS